MNIYDALGRALGHVDESDWRGALDALHDRAGSWKALAGQLGVDRRTVERWRFGYVDSRSGQRRQISQETVKRSVVPKVRKALKADRRAQVARADWSKLSITAKLTIGNYDEQAHVERMALGAYLTPEAIAGIADAYVSGDPGRVERAVDDALSEDYTGTGDAHLGDVEDLDFG